MSPKTLDALGVSIIHWEENLKYAEEGKMEEIDIRWKSCALCRLFYLHNVCSGCPIDSAGHHSCYNTPYAIVHKLIDHYHKKGNDEECKKELEEKIIKACKDEIEFLKNLLPEEE